MPFYEGPTLKDALAELGHVPSEAELRAWLAPLLDALAVMHAARCFHRDIAPDNILLTPIGPLLLDFGAARRVIGDMTHALTVVLKPGYAPIEQYGDVASMAQGAWTDLYALACVVYYAITGRTPMSSVERLMDDRLEPIAVEAKGRYSDAFLRAIDAALAVRPSERPQNAAQFRALLDADSGRALPPSTGAVDMLQLRDSIEEIPDRVVAAVPRQLMPVLATEIYVRPPEPEVAPPSPAPDAAATEAATAPPPTEHPNDAGTPEATQPMPRSPASTPGATPLEAPIVATSPEPSAPTTMFAPTLLQPRVVSMPAVALDTAPAPAPALDPSPPPAFGPEPHAAVDGQRRSVATTIVGTAAVIAVGAIAVWAWQARDTLFGSTADAPSLPSVSPSAPPTIAARPVAAPTATTTAPAPIASQVASPATVPSMSPASMPAASAPPIRSTAAPLSRPTAPPPAATAHPHREPDAPRAQPEPDLAHEASPTSRRPNGGRCSDILQKASLEPLTAEEAAYLKRECR